MSEFSDFCEENNLRYEDGRIIFPDSNTLITTLYAARALFLADEPGTAIRFVNQADLDSEVDKVVIEEPKPDDYDEAQVSSFVAPNTASLP